MQWVYRTSDAVFVRDKGGEPLGAGEAVAEVTRRPDVIWERYGDPTTTIRLATNQEVAAARQAKLDATAVVLADDVVAKAIMKVAFEEIQKCTVRAGQTLLTANEWRDRVRLLVAAGL